MGYEGTLEQRIGGGYGALSYAANSEIDSRMSLDEAMQKFPNFILETGKGIMSKVTDKAQYDVLKSSLDGIKSEVSEFVSSYGRKFLNFANIYAGSVLHKIKGYLCAEKMDNVLAAVTVPPKGMDESVYLVPASFREKYALFAKLRNVPASNVYEYIFSHEFMHLKHILSEEGVEAKLVEVYKNLAALEKDTSRRDDYIRIAALALERLLDRNGKLKLRKEGPADISEIVNYYLGEAEKEGISSDLLVDYILGNIARDLNEGAYVSIRLNAKDKKEVNELKAKINKDKKGSNLDGDKKAESDADEDLEQSGSEESENAEECSEGGVSE